jgi:hypothetical protein
LETRVSIGDQRAVLPESDVRETVKVLDETLSDLKRRSDLEGLLKLEAQAHTIASGTSGRARRKAERVANAASSAANDLRRNGAETEAERAVRVARESRESLPRLEADRANLLERLVSLLHLLLYDGSPEAAALEQLSGFASSDQGGFLKIELPTFVTSRAPLLLDRFDRSYRIFAAAPGPATKPEVEHELKAGALDLISGGAEVRGLTTDCVPLAGYCLFVGRLRSAIDVDAQTMARINDVILGASDEIARLPSVDRPSFFAVLRLSVLLGEAQACAARHNLATLSFS